MKNFSGFAAISSIPIGRCIPGFKLASCDSLTNNTHRNLLDEAETSFTNKMAVSRGNAKVKTTKELVASLQSRTSLRPEQGTPGGGTTGGGATAAKPMEDLNERAAKLTERVSIIDQKLNTNANR